MDEFAAKLELLLKARNLSRGRLASLVGVDKSVVSRWTNGVSRPTDHNLSRITELVRKERPDFSLLTWELPLSAFSSALGVASPDPPAREPALPTVIGHEAGLPALRTVAVSRAAGPREGTIYPGVYLGYRLALANTGATVHQALMLRLEGDVLTARSSDGFFNYRGEALLLRGQLFVLVEEVTRLDEVLTMILNGVSAPMAKILDGLFMGVAGDRTCTPSATGIVFQRVLDVTGDDAADEARWADFLREVVAANTARRAREVMPPAFAAVVDSLVGVRRPDGELDRVLRLPFHRSLSTTTTADTLAVP